MMRRRASVSTGADAEYKDVVFQQCDANGDATITYPGSVNSGDLLILVGTHDTASIIFTTPSGWTAAGELLNTLTSAVFYRTAGVETSVTAESNATNNYGGYMLLVFGGSSYGSIASASGATGNPDPPSISGSAGDMVLVIGSLEDDGVEGSVTAPTNYTLIGDKQFWVAVGLGVTVMAAYREGVASFPENPSAFSSSGDDDWHAYSINLTS